MKPYHIDLTGLSIEAALKIAARDFLQSGTAALEQLAKQLSRDGVGRDEINAVLERQRLEFEAWRVKSLAELRVWLERNCASLN